VGNWHVSDEPPLSDHRYINFQIGNITVNEVTFRNPRRTNSGSYKDNLKLKLETMSRRICMIRDTDRSADQLQQAIILSYYHNCLAKTTRSPRTAPWWNKKLSGLRAKTRRLFNIAKRTGQWDTYMEILTCYKKEIRKAKRSPWRGYCQEISDVRGSARFMKNMAKQATNKVSAIKLPDGQYSPTGKETRKEMSRINFPDSKLIDDLYDEGEDQQNLGTCGPELLQQRVEDLVPLLCCIFRACMAYRFIPMAWRQVKVTFIPKSGKLDYTEAKAYRPISLSFLFKTMEKLVDRYIRDGALKIHHLHRNQHVYQIVKSAETALHNVVTLRKCYCTQGAFRDRGSFQ
jgi:hypothetical protein